MVLSVRENGGTTAYETGKIRNAWWKHISYVPQAAQSVLNPITPLEEPVPGLNPGGIPEK